MPYPPTRYEPETPHTIPNATDWRTWCPDCQGRVTSALVYIWAGAEYCEEHYPDAMRRIPMWDYR